MNDADKLVAAILAAAKVSAMGERPVVDYIAEYEAFLRRLQSSRPRTYDAHNPSEEDSIEIDAEDLRGMREY